MDTARRSAAAKQLREMQERLDLARAAVSIASQISSGATNALGSAAFAGAPALGPVQPLPSGVDGVSSSSLAGVALIPATSSALSPLTIFSCHFEQDPSFQLTFPMRLQPLWAELQQRSRAGPQRFSPESLYQQVLTGVAATAVPWVVVRSNHCAAPLVVHAEDLRSILSRLVTTAPHCVVDHNGLAHEGSAFWKTWEYRAALQARLGVDKTGVTAVGAARVRPAFSSFPGELLRPLRGQPGLSVERAAHGAPL